MKLSQAKRNMDSFKRVKQFNKVGYPFSNFKVSCLFLRRLSASQTTNRQSYRATLIKSALLKSWSGDNRPGTRANLVNLTKVESAFTNRFISRYLDLGRCFERNRNVYPSGRLVEDIVRVCESSNIAYVRKNDSLGISIAPKLLDFVFRLIYREQKSMSDISGQLIRMELALWEQLLKNPAEPLTCSEIASRARIKKSTLTTLLDVAVSQHMLEREIDPDDERITRWKLNPNNQRNQYFCSVINNSFPDMKIYSRLPQLWFDVKLATLPSQLSAAV